MDTPGSLQIVDVYQSWAGPCTAIQSTFQNIFFEHGDKPMKFFTADASVIPALKSKVGPCEPVFCFYRDGAERARVHAVTAPELTKIIHKELGV